MVFIRLKNLEVPILDLVFYSFLPQMERLRGGQRERTPGLMRVTSPRQFIPKDVWVDNEADL